MKKLLLLLLLFSRINVFGQTCEGYFPVSKGTVMENTTYNEKGKAQTIVTVTIKDILNDGNAIKLSMHSDITNEKGKSLSSADYDAQCSNGNFLISMKSMLTSEQLQGMKDMTVSMEADDIEYPFDVSPGQTMKDAHLKVDVSMNGINMPGTKIDIINRKAVGTESITTPAGTFDCIKVTSDVKVKSIIGYETQLTEWLSKGNGVVRSESHKNGKLKSYTVLTKRVN